jgi:uncharacterized protein (TIGR03435 family)
MQKLDDNALLREYAERGSEEAFSTLVTRHIDKVYSVAMRHTGNPAEAEEITQAVFVIFAKKSRGLGKGVLLSGWFYQTARLTSVTFIRSEVRRARRQQEAFMQNVVNESDAEVWAQIAPLLDAAMAHLNEIDRHAVVLRFFDRKSMKEVGDAMGATEDAAKKRVTRALEKLRKYFSRHGVTSTTAIIGGAISANSVLMAPAPLAKSVAAVAIVKSAMVNSSTLTLIKGALKAMAWTKAKTAVIAGIGILLAAGTATVVVERAVAKSNASSSGPVWADDPTKWESNSRVLDSLPPVFILRPTRFANDRSGVRSGNRQVSKGVDVGELIGDAYSYGGTRMVLPPNLSTDRFDFLYTLPGRLGDALQKELKQRFGIVAHLESRDMEIFRLRVSNPNPPNLKRHTGNNQNSSWNATAYKATIQNQSIDGFLSSIEPNVGKPVVDETGLSGRYDLELQWQPKPGESRQEAYRRALSEQLGLELVPDHTSIEELVVEKVD